MYTTDFAYDGPIFLVPLSPSYPSSPVHEDLIQPVHKLLNANFHSNLHSEFINSVNMPIIALFLSSPRIFFNFWIALEG